MASRVVSSVLEQACDLLDTIRTRVAECKDICAMVQILDLLDDAEMDFENATSMWRIDIAGPGPKWSVVGLRSRNILPSGMSAFDADGLWKGSTEPVIWR